jgi:prepilin-type processing-associated H-X9-DG protein
MIIARRTLLEGLFALAVLAGLAAIFIPFLRNHTPSSDVQSAVAKAMVFSQAALQYAEASDGVLPRLDNNGSCLYGQSPCETPDWGDLRFPGNNVANLETGSRAMFFGALRPFLGNYVLKPDRAMGYTRWNHAFQNASSVGFIRPDGSFVSAHGATYYDWVLSQMAVNILMVDYNSTSLVSANNRPGAIKGRVSQIMNPSQKVLMTMESSWDWNDGLVYGVGNLGVWPSWPDENCYSNNTDGFTFYVLNGYRYFAISGDPNRPTTNKNLQGSAVFVFADGHVAPMRYPEAEACVELNEGQTWQSNSGVQRTKYYPHWVPEIN